MLIFWTLLIGVLLGYVYGHYIKPNRKLHKAIQEARRACAVLQEDGNKGVYRTIITDHNQTSELVAEVRELAVTKAGQVKVEYISAYYKNPEFRTKKGEALLREVRELLGEYLPLSEIEWYENSERDERIHRQLSKLDNLEKHQFGE
ncbi:hypothetical protein ACFSRY_01735 [Pontibacter locisalis]|uniref:Uncharacterized protein n=1 Tax=Pontibacter locisalis TaxID=1719035 RepID=A0ABW5IH80_9BACT